MTKMIASIKILQSPQRKPDIKLRACIQMKCKIIVTLSSSCSLYKEIADTKKRCSMFELCGRRRLLVAVATVIHVSNAFDMTLIPSNFTWSGVEADV